MFFLNLHQISFDKNCSFVFCFSVIKFSSTDSLLPCVSKKITNELFAFISPSFSYHLNCKQRVHIFKMQHCFNANLTTTDFHYYKKIVFGTSWAWWLNHIGRYKNHFSFCHSIINQYFRNIYRFSYRIFWKYCMSNCSLSST